MPLLRRNKKQLHRSLVPMTYPISTSPISWVRAPSGNANLPEGAFAAFSMLTGESVFIARGRVDGQIVTGYTTPVTGGLALIPYGLQEFRIPEFEVLMAKEGDLLWEEGRNGETSLHSVKGGYDRGEQQYIGRTCTRLNSGMTRQGVFLQASTGDQEKRVGKVHKSHGCLYVPYEGQEYVFEQYEVLRHKISPGNLASVCKWNIHEIFRKLDLGQDAFDLLPIPQPLKAYLKASNNIH